MKRAAPMTRAEQHTRVRLPFYGLLVFNRAILRPVVLDRLRRAIAERQLGLLDK